MFWSFAPFHCAFRLTRLPTDRGSRCSAGPTLSSELRITRAGTAYTCSVDEVTEAVEVTHGGITGSGTRYGMAILVGPLFTNSEYGEVSRELEL